MWVHITNAFQDTIDYFQSVPNSTWYTIAVIVGSSALVSGVLQAIKHWFTVTEKKRIVALLTALSLVASYLGNFIQYGTAYPKFLGDYTFQIVGLSTVIYQFFTSPIYKKLINYVRVAEGLTEEIGGQPDPTPVQADTLV